MTRTIAHLSDLHFGRIDPDTLDPLVDAVERLRPDLIAVSGDLTQRARRREFEDARAFLDRMPGPRIVVPGNHDVPLRNPWARFVSKWGRFRTHIHEGIDGQTLHNDEIAAVGINTARALAWKGGRINSEQMSAVRRFFHAAEPGALKVLVAHHPFDLPEEWAQSNQTMRAGRALEHWLDCGVDLILAGHVHKAFAGGEASALRLGNHKALIVQAGTATSTRGRGEANSFNAIAVHTHEIVVRRMTWTPEDRRFVESHEDRFRR